MKPIYKCGGRYSESGGRGCILLLDPARRIRLSKLMSALLRHIPGEAGLKLRSGGWIPVEELVEAIRKKWRNRDAYQWVTRDHVVAVALLDPKGRFEVKEGLIRARYGHTVPVKISYPEDTLAERLFHGTTDNRLHLILTQGLRSMKRLYVHLSPTMETACETASRHKGRPMYLEVDAECLRMNGYKIYRASSTVYLVGYVPPKCIVDVKPCINAGQDATSPQI